MAKRRSAPRVDPWSGETREDSLDGLFRSMRDTAAAALERDDISIASEADRILVGMPFPHLSQRYLYQSTVMPLGRVIQMAGMPGSGKSAMLHDLTRLHMLYGGGAFVAETEDKDAPLVRNGVLEWNPRWVSRVVLGPADTLEEWQAFILTSFRTAHEYLDKEGGPGRSLPILFGVDSLTAVANNSQITKTEEAGFSSLGYASVANLISRFAAETFSKNLRGYPFTIAATNHLKPGTDTQGRPTKNVPGGKAVPFRATFLLEMSLVEDLATMEYEGIRVRVKMAKNSVGTSRRELLVNLLWGTETNASRAAGQGQRFWWDWNTATIEMLLAFEKMSAKKTLFNELMDIVDLHPVSGKKVWSRALGISKEEPVPYSHAGYMLDMQPALAAQLHPLLGINNYMPFQPGTDYMAALEAAKQAGSTAPADAPVSTGEDDNGDE